MEQDLSETSQLSISDLTILLRSLRLVRLGTEYSIAAGQALLEWRLLIILRRSDSIARVWVKVRMTIICPRNYYTIKLKDKLPARDMNTEAITSDLRTIKTARFNPHGQSYKVLSFRSYYYFNYDLIIIVIKVRIEEYKYLRSGNTVPTIHSQVSRLEILLQSIPYMSTFPQ